MDACEGMMQRLSVADVTCLPALEEAAARAAINPVRHVAGVVLALDKTLRECLPGACLESAIRDAAPSTQSLLYSQGLSAHLAMVKAIEEGRYEDADRLQRISLRALAEFERHKHNPTPSHVTVQAVIISPNTQAVVEAVKALVEELGRPVNEKEVARRLGKDKSHVSRYTIKAINDGLIRNLSLPRCAAKLVPVVDGKAPPAS